jgi:N-acetyl-anhydromuramyl-L-alanine amidase AmpD
MTHRTRTEYICVHRYEVDPDSYHYTVRRDGLVEARNEEHLKDKSCRNFNSVAVSVAAQGCFLNAPRIKYRDPDPFQWQEAVRLVAALCQRYPGAKVVGHSQLGPGGTFYVEKLRPEVSCPGPRWNMDKFRADVADELHRRTASA